MHTKRLGRPQSEVGPYTSCSACLARYYGVGATVAGRCVVAPRPTSCALPWQTVSSRLCAFELDRAAGVSACGIRESQPSAVHCSLGVSASNCASPSLFPATARKLLASQTEVHNLKFLAEACADAVSAANVHVWCTNRMNSTHHFMSDPDTMTVLGPGSSDCTPTAPVHGVMFCEESVSTRGELLQMAQRYVLDIIRRIFKSSVHSCNVPRHSAIAYHFGTFSTPGLEHTMCGALSALLAKSTFV